MADDSKIRPSDFIEDDGTLQGIIRQINGILDAFEDLNNAVKKEDFTKWLDKLKKGSNEEKLAIQALTATSERLLALEQRLIEVKLEESKELARLNQMIKDENRDKAKEAEINSKVAGSYARMKLELQQFVEQYKNTTDASQKSKLADSIILLSNELMLADKELKNLMNDYTKLSATEQARLATLERERAESEAAAESIKKRAKAEAELNEVTKNRGAVESTTLAEQMRKAIEERIQLEAKELMLQDQFYAKELSSAEMIKQRLAIKEQLTQTEAKLKALEMQEANDLAIVKARVTMKQQQLDVEAKIVAAESQEGRNLAENEAKLKRIQQQNERNAQIATAVAGSYEHMKLTLQAKLDVLNNVNRSQGVAFSNALAEVAAAQQQVTEAEAWLNIVKQQANEQVKLNLLSDQEYQSMVQKNKELALEIKYTQGVVDSRAKLAAIQQAATTYNANGQSQLEEIKYNEQLAASYQKVEEAKAKAAFAGTQAYKDQIQAESDMKKARLEAMADVKQEDLLTKDLSKGTYAQLEARYKLLVKAIEELDNSSDDYLTTLENLKRQLNGVADALEKYDKASGKPSSFRSSRQREWNGLTNSVYQLSREIPNLAVRADTFFLAISNNIPIFIDEFKRAKNELGSFNKALSETGKAFAKSLPLALVLLALSNWSKLKTAVEEYFGTLADGSMKASLVFKQMAEKVESATKKYGEQIAEVNRLKRAWDKASPEERSIFMSRYRDEIDKTGYSIKNLDELERLFTYHTGDMIEALAARAKAAAALTMAQEKYSKSIAEVIKLEQEATELAGKEITFKDMRVEFGKYYGLTELSKNTAGTYDVSKEMFERIMLDFIKDYGGQTDNEGFNTLAAVLTKYINGEVDRSVVEERVRNGLGTFGGKRGADMVKEAVKAILGDESTLKTEKGMYRVPLSVMAIQSMQEITGKKQGDYFLPNYFGGGYRDLQKHAENIEDANRQAEQFLEYFELYTEQGKDLEEAAGLAYKAVKDLEKSLRDFSLNATKALNQQILATMNSEGYRRGGVNFEYQSYKTDENGNLVKDEKYGLPVLDEAKKVDKVTDSYQKASAQAKLNLDETLQSFENIIQAIIDFKNKVGVTDEQKAEADRAIAKYRAAGDYAYQAYIDETAQNEKDRAAAMARVYADNLNMRLEAIKEGNDKEMAAMLTFVGLESAAETNARLEGIINGSTEELALRKKALRAAMNAEIAENAALEPIKQKSVAAIRAKYALEEERMVREHIIKINTYRKQQLENENAAELSLTLDYYSRRRAIQQIELENELLENAELIENGQIKQEDIIRKHLKAQENLWKEHRNAVLSSQKSMWDVVEELAQTDSYEQLAAQLNKYDIELEQTKLQQQEIIDLQIPQELERIATERANLVKQLEDQTDLTDEEIELINKQIEGLDDEALRYEALSKEVADYIKLLTQLTRKRKQEAINQRLLNIKQREQQIQSISFYSQQQVGERQGQSFELQQEIELLELQVELERKIIKESKENSDEWARANTQLRVYLAQLNQARYEQEKVNGWQGTLHAISQHGLMAGIMQLPQKDANGNTMRDDNGAIKWKDLSADQYDAVNTALDTTKTYVNELMQSYVDLAQAAYDAAQVQVDAAKTAYEAELEARANGYANDVEGAKQELALERRKAKQKEQILKSAQKAQEHINTLQQISSLITGSAQILETFAAYPVIAGVLLAAMWGSFAAAKIKANQVANQSSSYGEGGFEVAVGGSHASGHDIKTGIKTTKGSQMVIEGGEGVGVFSRKAVTKYGDIIPNLVDSINDGSYSYVGNSQGSLDRLSPAATYSNMDFESAEPLVRTEYAKEIMAMQPITNETDLSAIEGKLDTLIKLQDNKQLVLSDGSIMERKGNKVTIIRRG